MRVRARRRTAAFTLFFILVGMPFMWVAGALMIDTARITMTREEVQLMLDAAVLAAASQTVTADLSRPLYEQTEPKVIEQKRAENAAKDVVAAACGRRLQRLTGLTDCRTAVTVVVAPGGREVSVLFDYEITGLAFIGLWDIDSDTPATSISAKAKATASMCFGIDGYPGLPNNAGRCTRSI
jgi:hypothetical protein